MHQHRPTARWARGPLLALATALAISLAALCTAGPVLADEIGGADQIQALRDENAELRRLLAGQAERLNRLEEGAAPTAGGTKRNFGIELSGFVKFDTLWNSDQVGASTSAPRFAANDDLSGAQYTSTVQHSRINLALEGPEVFRGARLRGWLEMDFFNLGDTGDDNFNNNQLRVRNLYGTLEGDKWRVLMGQAWDLFGPLNANTLNTNGNVWFGGNVGFRRPQIQARYRFDFEGGWSLTPAFSINANTGVNDPEDLGLESGRDSGVPLFQASLISKIPFLDRPIELGAWGVWGIEDLEGLKSDVDQWGVGGHFIAPITDWLKVQGEIHHGRNLNGGLAGQGTSSSGRPIASTGGFVQVTLKPFETLEGNFIAGVDDPRDGGLSDGDRSWNRVFMGNLKYRIFEPVTMAVEYERFDTTYQNEGRSEANVVWFAGILDF